MKLLTSIPKITLWTLLFVIPTLASAAEAPKPSSLDNSLAIILLIIIIVLALIIGLLAYIVIGAAGYFVKKTGENTASGKIISLFILMFVASSLFAQDAQPVTKDHSVGGLDSVTFFLLMTVITVEVIVIFSLLYFLQRFIAKEKEKLAAAGEPYVVKESLIKIWWDKVNSFRSVKEEADIQLDHNYDGIRELDNRLPPWWLYGFYLTIIVAVIYLWRFHVSHSAPSTIEEYNIAVQKAAIEKEAYLAKAANMVDENSVVMLNADGINSGKGIFTTTCAPCHGANGAGLVGPNLTDAYWIHGGSLKDIFKTIKYGVQEKGMKSWKDDFSPVQIAQLASFVKSLQGNKVANPKEPQGELYKEELPADSTAKK